MRRIKHNLGRLPQIRQIRMGHHRMPDAFLGVGLAGAIAVGALLPATQAIAGPSHGRAESAAVATDGRNAEHGGDAAASRSEDRQPVQQDQQPAAQPQEQQPAAQPQEQQPAQQPQEQQPQPQPAEQPQPQPQPEPAPAPAPQPEPAPAPAPAPAPEPAKPTYANNLDGWIAEARDVLAAAGKPVPSAKAMRAAAIAESSGNPNAVNNWDSNAKKGTPSIGLTQMIEPTFRAYALPGHKDIRNPVDNLIASSRYCDARYGSMDNMAAARGYGAYWRGY
ncbi:transglycosylase SLT domain-containing protein [Kitasatospora sp. NPDC059646]|uniref:lytic transglycosylase domain-containing protein n=1 Tax=Kitasatospora sp. NPDC059646 TaxID=3346893 RepID=UPI0036BAFF36